MRIDDAKRMLMQSFRRGRLAHAYLLIGSPRGAAAEFATFILQMVGCLEPNAPCGICDICRQIAGRSWCDNLWVSPLKKSRVISIDQMRPSSGSKLPPPYLLPWLGDTSFSGGWKGAVLLAAERLNESAANALLKMLEEPPQRTLILLVTDSPQALLPTIRSRCHLIQLAEPLVELDEPWRSQLLGMLSGEELKGPAEAMAVAHRMTMVLGQIREHATTLIKNETQSDAALVEEDDDVTDGRITARYRELRSAFLQLLQRWYRDLLTLRAGAPGAMVHNREHLETLRQRAERLTLAQALINIEHVEELARQMERSMSERTLLAYWLDRLHNGVS